MHMLLLQVIASRGNNLHEVETAKREKYLVSMPSKFRKHVWIKRGQLLHITFYKFKNEDLTLYCVIKKYNQGYREDQARPFRSWCEHSTDLTTTEQSVTSVEYLHQERRGRGSIPTET